MGGMENRKAVNNRIQLTLQVVVVFALAAVVFLAAYQHDNKYTAQGPKARDGILALDKDSLVAHPVLFLVNDWEYYANQLLRPEDFVNSPPVPDQYMFIGQFGGFEKWNNGHPHGSASYRLRIQIPEELRTYTLELPEVFSAYRLYINGKQVAQMGEPAPEQYRPETGNRTVSIEADGEIELLFAVSDYSHFYSGMVYPPAFGEPRAVENLLHARLFFRSVLCAAALTAGLLSALISLLSRKNALAALYGILCLLLVGYTCYPITRTFFTGYQPLYVIENISFCAILAVVILLAQKVCCVKVKWSLGFLLFGGLMCIIAAMGPFLWRGGNLQLMLAYSQLISVYQWSTATFITAAALYGTLKDHVHTKPLLYGILIFDAALVMDRLLPLHEPMVTGWFAELASFLLVASIGVVVGQEVAARYRDTAILTERASNMERLYQRQQTYYTVLKQEMEESKKMRHNIRHHFTMIDGFIQNGQYDKLSGYVSAYKAAPLQGEAKEYCPIDVLNVLSHHYDALAAQNRIHLDIRCDFSAAGGDQGHVNMSDADLCCLYANLMENAMEACLRMKTGKRDIRVAIVRLGPDSLTIRVWNSTDSEIKVNGDSFLSSKAAGRQGYGLMSIRSIAEKYDGDARFHWNTTDGEFESRITVTA